MSVMEYKLVFIEQERERDTIWIEINKAEMRGGEHLNMNMHMCVFTPAAAYVQMPRLITDMEKMMTYSSVSQYLH